MFGCFTICFYFKVKRDFFGRPIVEKLKEVDTKGEPTESIYSITFELAPPSYANFFCLENQPPATKCPINETIWFKFKEGHSNAVRRPFLMSQLLK